jgi:polyhydroxyalkanoate synthesis regulator phasin
MSEEDVSRISRYKEAAKLAAEVGRARAEEILRELVKTGEAQRGDAQDWLDDFFSKSRERTEALVSVVRAEVSRQLAAVGIKDPSEIAKLLDWVRARVHTGDDSLIGQAKQAGQRFEQAATSLAKTGAAKVAGSETQEVAPRSTGTRKAAGSKASGRKVAGARKVASKTGSTAPKGATGATASSPGSASKPAAGRGGVGRSASGRRTASRSTAGSRTADSGAGRRTANRSTAAAARKASSPKPAGARKATR